MAIDKAVQSFALYGFPESHAISFALLAYASCYLKVHRAPEFYASLLNNQPMGFYSPATLVQDAKAHGVRVRSVSVLESDWCCKLEADDSIRLGLCIVKGLSAEEGERILLERAASPFESVTDFKRRVRITQNAARTLARVGALNGIASHRRDGLWRIETAAREDDLFEEKDDAAVSQVPLAVMTAFERLAADYSGTGLTTGPHPMKLVREGLVGVWRSGDLPHATSGSRVKIAGLVICRQCPGTAKGFVFVSLEDETGVSNAIVAPDLFERRRLCITQERFLEIEGVVQNHEGVILIKARKVKGLPVHESAMPDSHDFH